MRLLPKRMKNNVLFDCKLVFIYFISNDCCHVFSSTYENTISSAMIMCAMFGSTPKQCFSNFKSVIHLILIQSFDMCLRVCVCKTFYCQEFYLSKIWMRCYDSHSRHSRLENIFCVPIFPWSLCDIYFRYTVRFHFSLSSLKKKS